MRQSIRFARQGRNRHMVNMPQIISGSIEKKYSLFLGVASLCGALLCGPALCDPAHAQDGNIANQKLAQVEATGARELRGAIRRIAINPGDTDALTDAGNAALLLGDANAALNFFARAEQIMPQNGRIKAGLAIATVRTENPFAALRLFDEAVKLGVSERTIAADRAMAFDLLGNFERAQLDYQLARTAAAPDELIIAQAISLSLLGRKNDADAMLLPLLQNNDPSAWRARAYMLAARGDLKQSETVARGFLDVAGVARIDRYLRLMPQLTGAQQAAAIHLGHFPANNIGRDSEAVRRVASNYESTVPTANNRLVPSGSPLGPNVSQSVKKETKAGRKNRNETQPKKERRGKAVALTDAEIAQASIAGAAAASKNIVTVRDVPVPRPLPQQARPAPQIPPENNVRIASASPAFTEPAAAKPNVAIADPGFTSLSGKPVQGPTETGGNIIRQAAPVTSDKDQDSFDLAAVVGSINIPKSEKQRDVVPVDLKKIQAAKPSSDTPKPEPKSVKYPERYWVQIASGKVSALGFDFRKLGRKYPDLFKGRDGWTSLWGRTGRLLVGPFSGDKDARKWASDFRKAGGDGFVWKSDDGTVVDNLKTK